MKKIKFFVLENGIIHILYMNNGTNTTGKSFTVEKDSINVEELGSYSLYETLTELVETNREKFKNKYAFVDDNGIIHNVGKNGENSTFLACGKRRVKFENMVDHGFPPYLSISFVDPDGNNPDEGDFVGWDHLDLAKELDDYYKIIE